MWGAKGPGLPPEGGRRTGRDAARVMGPSGCRDSRLPRRMNPASPTPRMRPRVGPRRGAGGPLRIIIRGMIKPATFIARPRIGRPMREEEALAALERLGPTRKEAKAYLVLVRNGPSTASEVSHLLGVQYPAVYRVLHSLQGKGWIEASRDRPNRYRARNPRVVAEQARQAHADELAAAAEQTAALAEEFAARSRGLEADLYLYKGAEGVGNKLRE